MIEILVTILTGVNVGLVIINSYWAWKRTCYNRDTLQESREYWASWGKRKMDIATQVMREMGFESPEEFEKFIKKIKDLEKKGKTHG